VPAPARPGAVIVGDRSDVLSRTVAEALRSRGHAVRCLAPGGLGDARVRLVGPSFWVDERPVGAILFRARPDAAFAEGFAPSDRRFADAEVGATWLAALHLDSVVAVNRYGPAAWYDGAGWPVWRRLLVEAGVAVSPFAFGAGPEDAGGIEALRWHPYSGLSPRPVPGERARRALGAAVTRRVRHRSSVVACGEVVAGEPSGAVLDASAVLDADGVRLAEVVTDAGGDVLTVDARPALADPHAAARAAHRLVELYDAHLRRR
jgi:hypothetical protein